MTTIAPQAQFNHTFAGRMLGAGTEDAFVVLAEAKRLEAEGKSIIHLQIGEQHQRGGGRIGRRGVARRGGAKSGAAGAPG